MLVVTALLLLPAQPEVTKTFLPTGGELESAIVERDAELFDIVFARCEPARLRSMVTRDFEMYHDRDGVVARSAGPFIADYAKECTGRTAEGWRSRRELVRESLVVAPVPGFGAIEDGEHRFYERKGNGPERLAGEAHFTHLWALTKDGWKLARVFSFSHRAASQGAAKGTKP